MSVPPQPTARVGTGAPARPSRAQLAAPQLTVSTAGVAETPFSEAPIEVVPVPVVEIAPVLLIIATVISDELQVT